MEETVDLETVSQHKKELPTYLHTPVVDKPQVRDFKISQELGPVDWNALFGTKARFEEVSRHVERIRRVRASEGVDVNFLDRAFESPQERKVPGTETVYYYYKMPLETLMQILGKETDKLAAFAQYRLKEYNVEPPVIAFAVRSQEVTADEHRKPFQDFGSVAVTAGWTGNTFEMVDIHKNGNGTTMLDDLIESSGRGHGSVFVLPSLHFEGAYNSKKITDLPNKELFNSGRAAMFYEDMLSILGINNFIGHSRGGDVAALLQAKYPSLNCLALMPASDMEARSHMSNGFGGLKLLTTLGQIPLIGDRTPDFNALLGKTLTELLVRDGVLSQDIVDKLAHAHREVIVRAANDAITDVIGLLGEGYRDGWKDIEYSSGLPPVIALGKADALSIYATVKQHFDNRFAYLKNRIQASCMPMTADEVIQELQSQLVIEFENAGHYSFEDPNERKEILNRWWNTLEKTKITHEDLALVHDIRQRIMGSSPQSKLTFRIVPESHIPRNHSLNMRFDKSDGSKTTVVTVTAYEYEKIRRVAEQFGFDTLLTQTQVNEKQFATASGFTEELTDMSSDLFKQGTTETVLEHEWHTSTAGAEFSQRHTDLTTKLLQPAEVLYMQLGEIMPETVRRRLATIAYVHMHEKHIINIIAENSSKQFPTYTEAYTDQKQAITTLLQSHFPAMQQTLIASLQKRDITYFESQASRWFERFEKELADGKTTYEDVVHLMTGEFVHFVHTPLRSRAAGLPPLVADQAAAFVSNKITGGLLLNEFFKLSDISEVGRFVDRKRILAFSSRYTPYQPVDVHTALLTKLAPFAENLMNRMMYEKMSLPVPENNGQILNPDWKKIIVEISQNDPRLQQALADTDLSHVLLGKLSDLTNELVTQYARSVELI
ncbi:MAG: alpha/beta hydrolase [Patescibacteria group bacterium]|jgi:pimeloyl-ACP methyl ester carboxylesterase